MTKNDLFANPFSLTNNDKRQLNSFFDDDNEGDEGSYEQVNGHDNNDHGGNAYGNINDVERAGRNFDDDEDDDDEDYEYGDDGRPRIPRRRRRGKDDDTLGGLMPNMFSTNDSSSGINVIWLSILISLAFCLAAYYGLSMKANEREKHASAAVLEGNANVAVVPVVPLPIVDDNDTANEDEFHIFGGDSEERGYESKEEVGPALTYDQVNKATLFTVDSLPKNFDPFQLQQQLKLQPTKIKEQNDWLGAPFVVSPPQLPFITNGNEGPDDTSNDSINSNSRLGYFQYPTMVNGTIVFSTEGDLYLTRLPDNNNPGMMPAMKLTTTVGNALHPKLNPKFPHLLAYSATYSGTREVYLMDLRPVAAVGVVGAPGTPGGPALRLTYTPGGIISVVGWDEDGSSILYSATSMDVRALPDVRLFRLRLSWGGSGYDVESGALESVDGEDEEIGDTVESESSEGTVMEKEKDEKKDVVGNKNPQAAVEESKLDKKVVNAKKSEGKAEKGDKKVVNENKSEGKDKKGVNDNTKSEAQEWEEDDDDDNTIAGAQNYVDKIAPSDNPAKVKGSQSPNQGNPKDVKKGNPKNAKKTNKEDKNATKKGKDNDQRKLDKQERQRRHLAKLSAQQTKRRRSLMGKESSIHSIIEPIPLAQATEGVYHTSTSDAESCIYFTRFKQSSNTKRYVGGTAESLWAYCPTQFEDVAIPLTADYNGTSKSPSVYTHTSPIHGEMVDVLLFMSDRALSKQSNNGTEWVASSMDLWAVSLPISSSGLLGMPVRLTNGACQYDGMDLSEYAIDPATGGVILRIGADLHYMSSESIKDKLDPSSANNDSKESSIQQLPIAVYSDFSNMQERLLPIEIPHHITTIDAYSTSYGTVSTLLTARGQTFVAPVIPDTKSIPQAGYGGGGRNMPARRYKVAPGTGGGGLVRILSAKHIPQPSVTSAPMDSGERLALILATDPLSPTGEHAFYLIRTDAMASPAFGFAALYEYGDSVADTGLPAPFIGGHLESGGSIKEGGLGSVYADSIKISSCGRRFAFTDTDGRIVVLTIPTTTVKTENGRNLQAVNMLVLPPENEIGQPLVGDGETELVWSPGGRYLAIGHSARNQFNVISISDLGSPENGSIELGRIVQATADRFNSFSPVWGHASKDFVVELWASALDPTTSSAGSGATALLFLSDRDVKLTGNTSPWGTRAPSPSFDGYACVHILPLQSEEDALGQNAINEYVRAPYGGGGALEVTMEGVQELSLLLDMMQKQQAVAVTDGNASPNNDEEQKNATEPTTDGNDNSTAAADIIAHPFVIDAPISFGEEKDEFFSFARSSYRIDHIPAGEYLGIVCQLADDPSLLMLTKLPAGVGLSLFAIADWPSDGTEEVPAPAEHILQDVEVSSDGQFVVTIQNGKVKVTPRRAKDAIAFHTDNVLEKNIASVAGLHLSVWPNLEFQQMYKDAWRMLRDYFYDPDMHSLDWDAIFEKYLPLVERCSKREELDDVLRQMIGELSALHSFVYGGEYPLPHHGDYELRTINDVACLGAILQRSVEKRGYLVVDIPERDPDFHMIDGIPMYSPLSNQVLKLSGQAGLQAGDVIVAVNGENVMDMPDIHMLLRNTAGESVRLDVLRMESTSKLREMRKRLLQNDEAVEGISPEPLIVVPMTSEESGNLAYAAWEWKSRKRAKSLAAAAGFSCGYAHLQSMSGAPSMDSFVRGFYPDYDKDALIIDVRNNRGGNIDSWILDSLQRTAWMYWESRSSNITTGGLGWDMQFAFRGHLVVLINEHTSSDGEAFARGVSELGLGKLVGTRTWGGGIWLSSDNHLVDGGIASAPEVGTYNDNFGWGLGVENMGVIPDIEVDNNPKLAFDGEDAQLERAISVLKEWLEQEPVALPKDPGHRRDMNKKEGVDGCSA